MKPNKYKAKITNIHIDYFSRCHCRGSSNAYSWRINRVFEDSPSIDLGMLLYLLAWLGNSYEVVDKWITGGCTIPSRVAAGLLLYGHSSSE